MGVVAALVSLIVPLISGAACVVLIHDASHPDNQWTDDPPSWLRWGVAWFVWAPTALLLMALAYRAVSP